MDWRCQRLQRWYTQFSAYCSTIHDGEDVIKLLMLYKTGPLSAAQLKAAESADAVLWSQLARAIKPQHARFTVVEDNPWKGIVVLSACALVQNFLISRQLYGGLPRKAPAASSSFQIRGRPSEIQAS